MTALLAVMALLAVAGGAEAGDCAGLMTPGLTLPRGDINVYYGSPLQIDCHLDPNHNLSRGLDSSALRFYRGGDLVESEFLTVVNETVLRLRIERPPISESVYQCQLQQNINQSVSLCLNNVIVGLPPEEVRDFSCVSSNWQNLTCRWTSHPLYAKTDYNLRYKLSGRSSRNFVYGCPNVSDDGRGSYGCYWDLKTNPHYRQPYAEYLFNLTGQNAFGLVQQNFTFDHFANLKPAPPQNLTCSNRTSRSALVSWNVPFQLETLPVGLRHRLSYLSERGGNWTRKLLSFNSSERTQYELTDLRYPNSWYDVRVSIGTERAADDNLWSNFSSITFRTLSEPPTRPPQIDDGGFESTSHLEHRVVYVYWKQIEPYEENGEDFSYEVIATSRRGDRFKPESQNKVYALFVNMPLGEMRVDLTSINAVGRSPTSSRLIIPASDMMPPEPQSFTKIAFDGGTYELSWRRVERSDVIDYTIFWCDSSKDRPFQCDGRMNWTKVPATINVKNLTMENDRIYQFAISANTHRASSGMVWASCTVIPGRVVDKMRSVWINRVGDTYIEIGWKLDCSDRVGVITGYRISYCPIVSPHNRTCKGAPMNKTINLDGSQIHSNVTSLKPYTTYAISVSVLTRHGEGNPSDPLYNTTSEGPPTPPLNARIDKIENDSVVVSWDPPLFANGVLKYYEIAYDDMKVKADKDERSKTLVGLRSYSNYTLNVTACTVVCSSPSDSIALRTAVGSPGPVGALNAIQTNASHAVTLFWNAPARPGGTVDWYEIRVIEAMNNYNIARSYNTSNAKFTDPMNACDDPEVMIYYYYVRAVNLDRAPDHGAIVFGNGGSALAASRDENRNITRYDGPWSQEVHHFCFANQGHGSVWIVLGAIFAIAAFIAFVCTFKWLYVRFQFMRNIKPSMPPGLETHIEELGSHASKWTGPGKRAEDLDESRAPPSSDAESLLSSKKPFSNSLRGICQRSDCSVNTDSTALSLTSSNRASDDSKNATIVLADVRSESFSLDSSMRLRNVDRGSRPASAASADRWNLSEKADKSSESGPGATPYSAIGAWPDDDYEIESEPIPTAGRGYVTIGNIPNCATGSPAAPLIDIAPEKKTPVSDSSPYFFNGSSQIVQPVEKPKVNRGYVSANDPRVTGQRPAVVTADVNDDSSVSSYSDDVSFDVNLDVSFAPQTSDYVKRGDSVIANGMDASYLQKAPRTMPKRPDGLSVNMPLENGTAPQTALSPEAYCRFGPNTNVPHSFEFDRTDADGDYSAKDLDPEMLFFEEPPRSDRLIQSHYVPFKH